MDENLTPIIVAIVGVLQVILAVIFAKRQNKASAERDEAGATEAIGSSYSTLVIRLEARLDALETQYDELCEEYANSKAAWKKERNELIARIRGLENKYGL